MECRQQQQLAMPMSLNETRPDGKSAMSKRTALIWVLPNILGIAAYLYLSSTTWVSPKEPAGGPGDPIVWMLTAFPVIAVCAILDVVWIIRIFASRGKRWKPAVIWLFFVIAWYSAHRYDEYRSAPSNAAEHAARAGQMSMAAVAPNITLPSRIQPFDQQALR